MEKIIDADLIILLLSCFTTAEKTDNKNCFATRSYKSESSHRNINFSIFLWISSGQ